MTGRAVRAFLPLLLLATGAPPLASACSWIEPSPFDVVLWPTPEALAVTRAWDAGRFFPANGTFDPAADTAFDRAFALSPDGRWFATANGTYRETRTEGLQDTCDVGWARVTARDLATGEVVRVSDRGATALAGAPAHLALAQGARVALLAWGTFAEVAAFRVPTAGEAFAGDVRGLAFTPDGRILAAYASDAFVVFDVEARRVVHAETVGDRGSLVALALAPDGRALAVATGAVGEASGVWETRLDVLDLPSGARLASRAFGEEQVRDLAWGPNGLAVALAALRVDELVASRVALLDGDLAAHGDLAERATGGPTGVWLLALAWSPDGERLAVGAGGALHLLDPDLREVATFTLPESRTEGTAPVVPDRRAPFADEDGGPVRVEGRRLVPATDLGLALVGAVVALALLRLRPGQRL